ncbi:MAG: hypothetical protein ACLTZY_03440 [Alistipes indistinctus]
MLENAAIAPGRSRLVLLVGFDVKQAIYRWRGGDWQILGGEVNRRFRESRRPNAPKGQLPQCRHRRALQQRRYRSLCSTRQRTAQQPAGNGARTGLFICGDTCPELTDMLANAYEQRTGNNKAPKRRRTVIITASQFARPIQGEEEADKPPVIATVEELQQRGYSPSDITPSSYATTVTG